MRIFVGTVIQKAHWSKIMAAAGQQLDLPVWRRSPQEQWHVTSLFIGERKEESIAIVHSAITKIAAETAPIHLSMGKLVSMPKQEPTMLWIRFQPSPSLTALHFALANATGTEPSLYKPYWPHITLARRKGGKVPLIDDGPVLDRLILMEITLFVSTPSSEGTVHHALETWPLSGKDPVGQVEADRTM